MSFSLEVTERLGIVGRLCGTDAYRS